MRHSRIRYELTNAAMRGGGRIRCLRRDAGLRSAMF
jgi:hypothetical protein